MLLQASLVSWKSLKFYRLRNCLPGISQKSLSIDKLFVIAIPKALSIEKPFA